MAEITLTINNRQIKANEGETILSIARANGIYVPAICCLTRCSPTLACRLCMVDADGKRVYSCNAKAKDGMAIVTDSEEMSRDRAAIMRVYAINHPLQCGVCDRSGECELQDNTLFQEVSDQDYAIKDTEKKAVTWGRTRYDPALCIVCERCVTVCKDKIGAAALAALPRGSEAIAECYKESMPKDAYAVWNKLNKSLIAQSPKYDNCVDCGECAAVCPTGAMITADFQYRSNAWELRRVASSCVHCPSACHIFYEVKQGGIDDPSDTIYRVTNDFHFESLCSAGRFAFNYSNGAKRDSGAFKRAIEALKKAGTIRFSSLITNEEVLILNRLKALLGVNLVNKDAFAYRRFLRFFTLSSGRSLYSGSKRDLGDFIISIGCRLGSDNPALRSAVVNAVMVKKAAAIDFHPVGDKLLDSLHKNFLPMRAAPLGEEEILFKILNRFADGEKIHDFGGDGIVFSGEELEAIDKLAEGKERCTLIAGSDLIFHPRWKSIATLLGAIERATAFRVIISPSFVNSLGVALLADLDENAEGFTVGYNAEGDFTLSALGGGDLDMPSLNQQEGTVVNIDRRVLPIAPALPYNGYTLADLANEFGCEIEKTVDLTAELPKGVAYDDLKNGFGMDGDELRGYALDIEKVAIKNTSASISNLPPLTGSVLYRANPNGAFNSFGAKALNVQPALYASAEFISANALEEGKTATIDGEDIKTALPVVLERSIGGSFAFLPDFDGSADGYRFISVKVAKG
ncbi:MAG: NADH-quinone oxidoreductase subunit G [Helicobacteraceae bacterium]|jgi:NADH-quinone oxidoreductase subunit G|nr:NADH-quinone oxidoreductase subunit G [Helicobacteraceae bacterium]